jgi:putative lipoic acid-binding regulatory protein
MSASVYLQQSKQMASQDSEAFYQKLKAQLADTSLWPTKYLYKFIVPSGKGKVGLIEKEFNNMGAVITTKESSKGTYTSVSIRVTMRSPDAVISKYKSVGKIEGVISL